MSDAYLKRLLYLSFLLLRTTSEGNQFENLPSVKYRRGGKSSHFISGSPLSPGSYISSESAQESAGSSNSIDDSDVTDGHKHGKSVSVY